MTRKGFRPEVSEKPVFARTALSSDSMILRSQSAVTLFLLVASLGLSAQKSINAGQNVAVAAWLGQHPSYRLARDQDCECDEDLRTVRAVGYGAKWKPAPNYDPYFVTGDFNGDGVADFAVVVVNTHKAHDFTMLVFNGPIDEHHPSPAFANEHRDLRGVGLFYGPPRPKPYRLLVGRFEAEGLVLQPHGKTYRLVE